MDIQNTIQSPVSQQEQYVPSSVEKKKALMMYFLFGIMIVLSKKKVSDFEYFHAKQAMGWWMVFILSILVSAVILFIPFIKIIGILLILGLIILLIMFIKQAWGGQYYIDDSKYSLAVFPSLGVWLLGLFDISFDTPSKPMDSSGEQNSSSIPNASNVVPPTIDQKIPESQITETKKNTQ